MERWFLRKTIVKYVAQTKSEAFGKWVGKLRRKVCEVVGNKSENDLSKLKYKIHSIFVEVKAEITDGEKNLARITDKYQFFHVSWR